VLVRRRQQQTEIGDGHAQRPLPSIDDHSPLVQGQLQSHDANGEDFHIALAMACRHYIHELNDEQLDERRLTP
jgi:hypothetical protein